MVRRTMLAGLVLVLGWLALAGVACERDAEGEEPASRESSGGASGDEGATKQGSGAEEELPGEMRPGELKPESPGPKGRGIFFLGGLKGYLEPCGCTADVLLGGAERLAGFKGASHNLYSATLMVDAGDTFFKHRQLEEHVVAQERAKAKVIAELHQALQTAIMVPGERDFALGVDFYRERIRRLRAEVLGANVRLGDKKLKGATIREVRDWSVGFVGAVQKSLFDEIEGVEVERADGAIAAQVDKLASKNVEAVVLVWHGELNRAKELLEANPGVDFVVIGHGPRETDQVDRVNNGYTLEAYDQGRYMGVLKLFGRDHRRPFANARQGSKSEIEKVNRQIEHVAENVEKLKKKSGEEAPILGRLEERLAKLKARREKIAGAEVEIDESRRSFLYRSVPMRPGYPIDQKIKKKRTAYNKRLEELNRKIEREVPPVPEGEATYIGTNQCAGCHSAAHEFWKGTHHADALATLQNREKAFDQNCIGCHVVGYDKPGGSVLGKLKYEEKVDGQTITKDLRNVGCENCHGPGSKHRSAPVGSDGQPQYIDRGRGASTCKQCHVPEHSPKFDYETYVGRVTGQGHPLSPE